MTVLTIANLKEKGLLVNCGEFSILPENLVGHMLAAHKVQQWLKANCPPLFVQELTRMMIAAKAGENKLLNQYIIETSRD